MATSDRPHPAKSPLARFLVIVDAIGLLLCSALVVYLILFSVMSVLENGLSDLSYSLGVAPYILLLVFGALLSYRVLRLHLRDMRLASDLEMKKRN